MNLDVFLAELLELLRQTHWDAVHDLGNVGSAHCSVCNHIAELELTLQAQRTFEDSH